MTSSTRNSAKRFPTGFMTSARTPGCVSVGIDHDTAQFAVNAIRRWRKMMGRASAISQAIA